MKILLVEDEKELAKSIVEYLSKESYLCEVAYSYSEALSKIIGFEYDCILLDITLPGGSGLKLLEELKKSNSEDGVIIISAKNSLDDKITGLEMGADDYLTKPFHLSELSARIFSIIRRKKFHNHSVVTEEELQLDLLAKTAFVNKQELPLTKKEFELLVYFLGNKNRVLSKSTLAEHLSGDFADMLDNHGFVYAHVKNLKKKLSDAGYNHAIKTVYGTGYRWESK